MKYCSTCGAAVERRIPAGDQVLRFVCLSCETVHYQNPKLVVGCVPEDDAGRILICRRAIEPSPEIGAGEESLEVRMVAEHEIPWDDIAFTSTTFTLRRYLEDRAAGLDRHHFKELDHRNRG